MMRKTGRPGLEESGKRGEPESGEEAGEVCPNLLSEGVLTE